MEYPIERKTLELLYSKSSSFRFRILYHSPYERKYQPNYLRLKHDILRLIQFLSVYKTLLIITANQFFVK
jgi:hypothetical protein